MSLSESATDTDWFLVDLSAVQRHSAFLWHYFNSVKHQLLILLQDAPDSSHILIDRSSHPLVWETNPDQSGFIGTGKMGRSRQVRPKRLPVLIVAVSRILP
jgi:hypothetical protein